MPILRQSDELIGFAPRTWAFWRNLAVYFCALSIIGHWLEIAYCTFMLLFNIYDPNSLVWGDPLYPFMVYGIGATICTLALVPLRKWLIKITGSMQRAGILFLVITIFVCMVMELTMGLLLNQPDAAGVYPLWDNSTLPLNVLGQAWLVNDFFLGLVAMLYTWLVYPVNQRILAKIPDRILNPASIIFVIGFIVLCIYEFA